MEINRVSRVEPGERVDKAAGPVPRPAPGGDVGLPGDNATVGRVLAVETVQSAKVRDLELPEANRPQVGTVVPTYAKIRLDPKSHLISIEIYNAQTNEVIRQIPPEEIAKLTENSNPQTGVLVEKRR